MSRRRDICKIPLQNGRRRQFSNPTTSSHLLPKYPKQKFRRRNFCKRPSEIGSVPSFKCDDVVTFDLFALYFWNCLNPPFSGLFAFRQPKLRFVHFPSVRRVPDRLKNDFVVGFRLQTEKESAKVATSQLFPSYF